MPRNHKTINVIFGCVVGLLGGFALAYLYLQLERKPVIQPPAASNLPPDHPKLPADHPPIDFAKELLALEQLSRESPQNAEYKTRIGNIYYDMGQYQKAIAAYEQSLALSPQNPSVETDLATSLHYAGDHDKALVVLEKVLKYSPNFAQALFNKGVVLQNGRKDLKGAIAAWEELLRVQPDLPQRADLEKRVRDLKAAIR